MLGLEQKVGPETPNSTTTFTVLSISGGASLKRLWIPYSLGVSVSLIWWRMSSSQSFMTLSISATSDQFDGNTIEMLLGLSKRKLQPGLHFFYDSS
jgi:hypothetical protein